MAASHPQPTIRVLVADQDPLARGEIVGALEAGDGLELVAVASTPSEAVTLAMRERPDVVLMDASASSADVLVATARLASEVPGVRIVLLPRWSDPELGLLALRAGAVGFVPKSVSRETLARVVRDVARGHAAISRRLTMTLIERYRGVRASGPGLRPIRGPLTSRQWEVLDLLAGGATTRGVAAALGLSAETVRSHIKSALRKLGAHSRAEAIEKARALRDEVATTSPAEAEAEIEELEQRITRAVTAGRELGRGGRPG